MVSDSNNEVHQLNSEYFICYVMSCMCSYVLLEEFLKELGCISQAKAMINLLHDKPIDLVILEMGR